MANLVTENRSTPELWNNASNNPSAVRFTMMGNMQLQHLLDFSANVTPPPSAAHQATDVVDLSTRRDDSFSSSSSIKSEKLNSPPPSFSLSPMPQYPVISPQFPIVSHSQLPSLFNKKPHSATRPFKAYPKDPLNLPIGLVGGVSLGTDIMSDPSNKAYVEFRRQMLAQVVAAKSRRTSSPPPVLDAADKLTGMTRLDGQATQPEEAGSPQHPSSSATDPSAMLGKEPRDPAYWERRRKNNEAAKRSRDARRAKEDEIAIRAAFLEQENLKLKYEVAAMRNENTRLRCMLYNSS